MIRISIPPSAVGESLKAYLLQQGFFLAAPCGGRGTCHKCRVRVLSGQFLSCVSPNTLLPMENGTILACQAVCPSDGAEIEIPEYTGDGLTIFTESLFSTAPASPTKTEDAVFAAPSGIMLDIGTTTLAAVRLDRNSGKITGSASCLNPQQSFGADVINRIEACKKGQLPALQSCLLDAVRGLLIQLSPPSDTDASCDLVVTGNTTMLHIFCGVSPVGMGTYPFLTAFTDEKLFSGTQLSLPAEKVLVLPSASAFIGGDVIAGMLALHFGDSATPAALLDIGTNGEMVLDTGTSRGNQLFAVSTAAGPALEGANISCGMGGVAGAVSHVFQEGNHRWLYETIDDAPARGICGCGFIDLCAELRKEEILDETGYLEENPYILCGVHRMANTFSAESDTQIRITQKDIRELQLAKSAIRAGLETLLQAGDMDIATFLDAGGKVYLAGGFGYYLSPVNAAAIGLLPLEFLQSKNTVISAGNTALKGAIAVWQQEDMCQRAVTLSQKCTVLSLHDSSTFRELFMEHMLFPEI